MYFLRKSQQIVRQVKMPGQDGHAIGIDKLNIYDELSFSSSVKRILFLYIIFFIFLFLLIEVGRKW